MTAQKWHMDLVKLIPLMEHSYGSPEISIGLIDGPVALEHPELAREHVREIAPKGNSACAQNTSLACLHGTFIAGILSAKRGSSAPAICPGCTLLVRPIFIEASTANTPMPSATRQELAAALVECVEAGARCINLSLALAQASSKDERELQQVLDHAAQRGVMIVAAAGNQETLGSTAITRHPWVIPVAACDRQSRPVNGSNLGNTIGRRGLAAPGDKVTSLGARGQALTLGGTSAAAAFVTGTIALLWSIFPQALAAQIRLAVLQAHARQRASVVPPLLDAWGSYQYLLTAKAGR